MRGYFFILGAALLLLVGTYLLALTGLFPWVNHFLANIGFLVFLTFVSDTINQRALDQEGRGVIIPYIVSTILKLVLSAIFLILFIKQNMAMAREIVFSFLAYYAVFSTVEIVIVNRRLRLKKF